MLSDWLRRPRSGQDKRFSWLLSRVLTENSFCFSFWLHWFRKKENFFLYKAYSLYKMYFKLVKPQILQAQSVGTVQGCSIWLADKFYLISAWYFHEHHPSPIPPTRPLLFVEHTTCTLLSLSCRCTHSPWNLVVRVMEPPTSMVNHNTFIFKSLLVTAPHQRQHWVLLAHCCKKSFC